MKRFSGSIAALVVAGGLLAVTSSTTTASTVAPPTATVISCGAGCIQIGPGDLGGSTTLISVLNSLSATGTNELRLEPGLYVTNEVPGDDTLTPQPGTPTSRIKVTSSAPTSNSYPRIQGRLIFRNADYWTLNHLRFEASPTYPDRDPLRMAGGTGWVIEDSIFTADAVSNFTNVTLLDVRDSNYTSTGVPPTNFTIRNNCFHHGSPNQATTPSGFDDNRKDHLIYLTSVRANTAATGGSIIRNILFESRNGSSIKLNMGGVDIAHNTFNGTSSAIDVQENDPSLYTIPVSRIDEVTIRRNLIRDLNGDPGFNPPDNKERAYSLYSLDRNNAGNTGKKVTITNNYIKSTPFPNPILYKATGDFNDYFYELSGTGSSPALQPTESWTFNSKSCAGHKPVPSDPNAKVLNFGRYAGL